MNYFISSFVCVISHVMTNGFDDDCHVQICNVPCPWRLQWDHDAMPFVYGESASNMSLSPVHAVHALQSIQKKMNF